MSAFPQPLLDHLAGEATTVCHCWRLSRRDGTVTGFTDHDRRLTVDGIEHRPETGFSASEVRSSLGMAIDTADVEGVLSSDAITDADIDAGLYDGATVETLLVNWRAPDQHALLRRAVIGRIERRDGRFVAELESLSQALDRPMGRIIRRRCDAELGDGRCKVDLDDPAYRGNGTVTAVDPSGRIIASGLATFAAGWFASGFVTFTSGARSGSVFAVTGHAVANDGAELSLWSAPDGVEAGDGFSVVAGCDKRFETCRTKFDNVLNFRGFPQLPGNDAAYGYVNGQQVFDGGALVP
ncbi:MAG: DUF2163 domain-containing protein [Rhizobiaceae bacterium]|nr:DUF2163 domain-containing protein [Rhizobiaceae bacterium]MCV0405476.1 DUF2163 domain-containing protein [Rhizobiaceae bacterium]